MADYEFTLTQLSVTVASSGEEGSEQMTATIDFTKAGETFKVTLPDMLHDKLRRILAQLMRSVSVEAHAATLTEAENFTTDLI